MSIEEKFDCLCNFLTVQGYKATIFFDYDYRFAQYHDVDKRIGFTDDITSLNAQPFLSGRVAIDGMFNKWSQVPCSLPLPGTEQEYKFVLEQIKFWFSDKGIALSDNFAHEYYIFEYPKGINNEIIYSTTLY